MMKGTRLDSRDKFPVGMEDYLSHNGWHFNKKMSEWASRQMKRKNASTGNQEPITPYSKDEVDEMLVRNGITLQNAVGYDYVYVANLLKARMWKSSLEDESHVCRGVKDIIDDINGYEGMVFTQFYADCIGRGMPIEWEDML